MEIKEVIIEKRELEEEIRKVLNEFTKKTHTNVDNITINHYYEIDSKNEIIDYRINISVYI